MGLFGRATLAVDRWTPFAITLWFHGIDLTHAILRAQFRVVADMTGPPAIDLMTVTTQEQGLRILPAEILRGVIASPVRFQIDEATIRNLPMPPVAGTALELQWDMHVTLDGFKQRALAGPSLIVPGVTQA